MPARKLSQADVDDLREAERELLHSRPRRITRTNGDGHRIVITTLKGVAEWKDITESYFYTLKNNGFRLKKGVPFDERPASSVPLDVLKGVSDVLQDRIEAQTRHIAELEAELAALRAERTKP